MEEFGKAIKILRKRQGYTQREFAEKLGVSNQVVSKWETGVNQPDFAMVCSICSLCGISVDEFIRLCGGEKETPVLETEEGVQTNVTADSADIMQAEKNDLAQTAGQGEKRISRAKILIITLCCALAAIVAAASVILSLVLSRGGGALSADAVYRKNDPSVFFICVETEEGKKGGSGFFIDNQGTAVTNFHVIEGGYDAEITLNDGRRYSVEKILGKDPYSDLVKIKVDIPVSKAAVIANSTNVKTGDRVYTIGYPESFSVGVDTSTFTEGIVSKAAYTVDGVQYIQTNADMTYGNSGGVLLNDRGQVIGVTTGALDIGGVDYMNLALPSNNIRRIGLQYNCTLEEFFERNKPLEVKYVVDGELWETRTVNRGDSAPVLTPKKTGYLFKGWYENEACADGTKYDFAAQITQSLSLYAGWTPISYTIGFEKGENGAIGAIADIHVKYDEEAALPTDGFALSGYAIKGWKYGEKRYALGETVKNLTSENGARVVFVAEWEPIVYTLQFDGDGATAGEMAAQTYAYGEEIRLPENGYTKTGYTFVGWQVDGKVCEAGAVLSTADINESKIWKVKASWSAITYTVVFESGEAAAEGEERTVSATYGKAFSLPENAFKLKGYMQTGWRYNGKIYPENGSVENLTATDGETLSFTAVWGTLKYPVVYKDEACGMEEKTAYTYGSFDVTYDAADRAGYIFLGWEFNGSLYGENKPVSNLVSYEGEEVVFIAKWQARTYHIRYVYEDGLDIYTQQESFTYDTGYTLKTEMEGVSFPQGYKIGSWTDGSTQWTAGITAPAFETDSVELYAELAPMNFRYAVRLDGEEDVFLAWSDWTNGNDLAEEFTYTVWTKEGFYADSYKILYADGTEFTGDTKFIATQDGQKVYIEPIWEESGWYIGLAQYASPNEGLGYQELYWLPYSGSFTFPSVDFEGYHFLYWEERREWIKDKYKAGETVYGTELTGMTAYPKDHETKTVYSFRPIWQPYSYKIVFNGNGATVGSMETLAGEYGVELTLTESSFKKSGYYFGGWACNGKIYADGQAVTLTPATDGEEFVFTAQWVLPYDGAGTESSPYLIKDFDGLYNLFALVDSHESFRSAHFLMTSDIDCENGILYAIGTEARPFAGVFDGGNHLIKNAVFTGRETYQGLFGYVTGGAIRNVGIENYTIDGGGAAPLVGRFLSDLAIENCYAVGTVSVVRTSRAQIAGASGLVGSMQGVMRNCYSSGTISFIDRCEYGESYNERGQYALGGLIGATLYGWSYTDTLIENCYTDITISLVQEGGGWLVPYVGGIVGMAEKGTYTNCVWVGELDLDFEVNSWNTQTVGGFGGYEYFSTQNDVFVASDSAVVVPEGITLREELEYATTKQETLEKLTSYVWLKENIGFDADVWRANETGKPVLSAFYISAK